MYTRSAHRISLPTATKTSAPLRAIVRRDPGFADLLLAALIPLEWSAKVFVDFVGAEVNMSCPGLGLDNHAGVYWVTFGIDILQYYAPRRA